MSEHHTIDREEVMALADGELAADRAVVVRAHLAECDACRAFAESLTRTSHAMAAWRIPAAPASLDARVLADVSGKGSEDAGGFWSRVRAMLLPGPAPWIAAAAAAVVIAGVMLPQLWPASPAPEPTTTLTDAAGPGEPPAAPFSSSVPVAVAPAAPDARPSSETARPTAAAAAVDQERRLEQKATARPLTARPGEAAPRVAGGLPAAVPPAGSQAGAANERPVTGRISPPPAAPVNPLPAQVAAAAPPPPPAQAAPPPGRVSSRLGAVTPARGGGGRGGSGATAAAPAAGAPMSLAETIADATAPMPARRVTFTIAPDRFDEVRVALDRIAAARGAEIAAYAATTVADDLRRITATLRVPPDRVDAAIEDLRRLGAVREESAATDDVRSAHVDLTNRLAASRAEESRLRDLIARRPAVQDALAVEAQLARASGESARLEDERRALADRVARATIVLQFDERR